MRLASFVQSTAVIALLLAWGCAHAVDNSESEEPLSGTAGGNTDAGPETGGGGSGGGGNADAEAGLGGIGGAGGLGGGVPDAAAGAGGTVAEAGPDADAGSPVIDAGPPDTGVPVDAGCVRETQAALCGRLQKNCGSVTGNDNCGISTMANCGACAGLETCGGGGVANVCGAPANLATGGTVTSSNPGTAPEDATKAFDGNPATKWLPGLGIKAAWIVYQFGGGQTHAVTSYSITSANDIPARDPASFQLQGSNDGTNWAQIDARTAQTFANRGQANTYTCNNATKYSRYRLNVSAVNGGNEMQLAEIQLFGN